MMVRRNARRYTLPLGQGVPISPRSFLELFPYGWALQSVNIFFLRLISVLFLFQKAQMNKLIQIPQGRVLNKSTIKNVDQ